MITSKLQKTELYCHDIALRSLPSLYCFSISASVCFTSASLLPHPENRYSCTTPTAGSRTISGTSTPHIYLTTLSYCNNSEKCHEWLALPFKHWSPVSLNRLCTSFQTPVLSSLLSVIEVTHFLISPSPPKTMGTLPQLSGVWSRGRTGSNFRNWVFLHYYVFLDWE